MNTWTLLTQNTHSGDIELHLKDDISDRNIGDEVGIATTRRGDYTRHRITAIDGQVITIDPALQADHWGGFRDLAGGYRLEMAAEVVNLERNIIILMKRLSTIKIMLSLEVAFILVPLTQTNQMTPFSMSGTLVYKIVVRIMSWVDTVFIFI